MSSVERQGRWTVPQQHRPARVLGQRRARLPRGLARARRHDDRRARHMGNLELILPPRLAIDVDVSSIDGRGRGAPPRARRTRSGAADPAGHRPRSHRQPRDLDAAARRDRGRRRGASARSASASARALRRCRRALPTRVGHVGAPVARAVCYARLARMPIPGGHAPGRLGRYELLARLATGGMGEIFLARLEGAAGFEKLFVVKRILPHLADDARFRQMLIAEARIAAKMSHPNICQVYELGETDGPALHRDGVPRGRHAAAAAPAARRSSRRTLDFGFVARRDPAGARRAALRARAARSRRRDARHRPPRRLAGEHLPHRRRAS